MNVWEVVDESPTLYVFGVAWLVYQLGNATRMRNPMLSVWQEAAGAGTFLFLALRRLVWEPPEDAIEVIFVLLRAGSFGCIAFGIAGTIGIVWLALYRTWYRPAVNIRQSWRGWREKRKERRERRERERQRELLPSFPEPPSAAQLQRQRQDQERREKERQQTARDDQRRRELRLKTELAMQFALNQDRRQTFTKLMDTYASETLPVEVYEERLATIEQAITQHSPRRAKRFQSMQEIIDEFDRQLQDLEQSSQPEIEKQSIRSMILMERNTAIQRFIEQ